MRHTENASSSRTSAPWAYDRRYARYGLSSRSNEVRADIGPTGAVRGDIDYILDDRRRDRGLGDRRSPMYLAAPRTGRRVPLDLSLRPALWQVRERFPARSPAAGVGTWQTLGPRAEVVRDV